MSTAPQDISNPIAGAPFIIVGFFTPNYTGIATTFSENLRAQNQPFHLYAVSANDWLRSTLLKPEIVLRAMGDYPGRTVMLLDIDCEVYGDLSSHAAGTADTAFHIVVKQRAKSITKFSSSRFVVFRNTPGARRLAEAWAEHCAAHRNTGDETQLLMAVSCCPGVTVESIPLAAEDGEFANVRHPLIKHKSARREIHGHNRLTVALRRFRRQAFKAVFRKDYLEWRYNRKQQGGAGRDLS
jgi:hypothetical protein